MTGRDLARLRTVLVGCAAFAIASEVLAAAPTGRNGAVIDLGVPCPGPGDCCDPAGNGSPGCDDGDCCTMVCFTDTSCCIFEWDAMCAELAATLCRLCMPPTGACCRSDGDCDNDTTQADCKAGGGEYLGDDSTCPADTCDAICDDPVVTCDAESGDDDDDDDSDDGDDDNDDGDDDNDDFANAAGPAAQIDIFAVLDMLLAGRWNPGTLTMVDAADDDDGLVLNAGGAGATGGAGGGCLVTVGWSVTSDCDIDSETAVVHMNGDTIPVTNGESIFIECPDSVLEVTVTDSEGNTGGCTLELCGFCDDDDDDDDGDDDDDDDSDDDDDDDDG